jgi:tripartite-type tricarboxylate transporter receptor subunit TctC
LSARLIAQKLSEAVGKQFYVENISGVGGNIAMGRAVLAAPDGYTLIEVAQPYVVNPALYDKVPYDPLKSFEPVTLAGTTNVVLAINPSVPAQSVSDLITLIKANPGKYSYGSGGGIGSPGHLVGEQFRLSIGLDLVHVPFNGANLAVGAVVAGHVPICFVAPPPVVPLAMEGKLRPLAGSGKTRLRTLPDVPTLAEAGYPAIEGESWFGFVAPRGTPREIIAMLNREIMRAVALPEVKERFTAMGIESVGSTQEEFTNRIKAEIDIWRKVIRTTGIRAE